MSYLPKPGADFEITPAGTHHAVCYRVLDLGTQKTMFQDKQRIVHQIGITWELVDELMSDGRPFVAHRTYTWSMSKKAALRKDLEAWRGQSFGDNDFGPTGFNIKNILGKCCTISIAHQETNGEIRSNISAVSKAMKGTKQVPPVNTCIYLWLEPDLFDKKIFEMLSEGLRDKIMRSPEYQSIITGKPIEQATDERNPPNDLDDDLIPF